MLYIATVLICNIKIMDANQQTVTTFRELIRRFERELYMQNSDSCCKGVTLAQCHTLLEIESKEKESLTELAKTLGLDKSTISRTVDCLVNLGLADRTIPAENRRMSTIQLTEAGKKSCTLINSANDAYFEGILSGFSDSDKKELLRLLEQVVYRMVELRIPDKAGCACSKVRRENSNND